MLAARSVSRPNAGSMHAIVSSSIRSATTKIEATDPNPSDAKRAIKRIGHLAYVARRTKRKLSRALAKLDSVTDLPRLAGAGATLVMHDMSGLASGRAWG
jgi:hypothetical protein